MSESKYCIAEHRLSRTCILPCLNYFFNQRKLEKNLIVTDPHASQHPIPKCFRSFIYLPISLSSNLSKPLAGNCHQHGEHMWLMASITSQVSWMPVL